MKYNILLFDADNTLLDFTRSEKEAVSRTFESFGIAPTEENVSLYSAINTTVWQMLERKELTKEELSYRRFEIFLEKTDRTADAHAIASRYEKELGRYTYEIDGAVEVCKNLHDYCRSYIITNGFKRVQQARLAQSSLIKYMDGVFISEEVGYEKPSREFFDKVSEMVGITKEDNVLVIGDSLTSDIKGGIDAGYDVCWYNPTHSEQKNSELIINYTISSLKELYGIVQI